MSVDFKTWLEALGQLDTNPSDALYGQPSASAYVVQRLDAGNDDHSDVGHGTYRLGFLLFRSSRRQGAATSFSIAVDTLLFITLRTDAETLVAVGIGRGGEPILNSAGNWAGAKSRSQRWHPQRAGRAGASRQLAEHDIFLLRKHCHP